MQSEARWLLGLATLLGVQVLALTLAAVDLPLTAEVSLRTSTSAITLLALSQLLTLAIAAPTVAGARLPVLLAMLLPATAAAIALDAARLPAALLTLCTVAGWGVAMASARWMRPVAMALILLPPALVYVAVDAGEAAPPWCWWTPTLAAAWPSAGGVAGAWTAAAVGLVARWFTGRRFPQRRSD